MNSHNNYQKLLDSLDANWTETGTITSQLNIKLKYLFLSVNCIEGMPFLSIRDISNRVKVSPATVIKVVDEFIRLGLLSRRRGSMNLVSFGAKKAIQSEELVRIYSYEVPSIIKRVEILGSNKYELVSRINESN